MARIIALLVLIFLAVSIQSTLFQYIEIGGVRPDLAFILMASVALGCGRLWGMLVGFWTGLLFDLLAPQNLGLNALLTCATGFTLGELRTHLYRERQVTDLAILFVAIMVRDFLYCLFSAELTAGCGPFHLRDLFFTACYTTLLAWPLLRNFHRIVSER